DDADGARVEENGHEQDRADALGLEPGAVAHTRIREHVRHHERLLNLEHAAREALAHPEALLILDVPTRGPGLRAEGQRPRVLAREPDPDDVDPEARLGDVGEPLEYLAEVER